MSKASEQMDTMTISDIEANPCGYCYACHWAEQHDCYDGNPAQCSVCSIILSLITKMKEEHWGNHIDKGPGATHYKGDSCECVLADGMCQKCESKEREFISLCNNCNCMTKTVDRVYDGEVVGGVCGKCHAMKEEGHE